MKSIKKLFAGFLIGAAVFAFAGCAGADGDDTSSSSSSSSINLNGVYKYIKCDKRTGYEDYEYEFEHADGDKTRIIYVTEGNSPNGIPGPCFYIEGKLPDGDGNSMNERFTFDKDFPAKGGNSKPYSITNSVNPSGTFDISLTITTGTDRNSDITISNFTIVKK